MTDLNDAIQSALAEAKAQDIEYLPLGIAQVMLNIAWAPPARLEVKASGKYAAALHPRAKRSEDTVFASGRAEALSPKRPPPWYIGFSKAFKKAVVGIDRKLQGRILEALADIESDPTTPRGDTVKPLNGDLKGCWRYRVGDYRLIYSPDRSTGDIALLAFAARGSAFD
jgi:mRNA-degrading endonuclease RelE of RelBE toxin-antitoxin system